MSFRMKNRTKIKSIYTACIAVLATAVLGLAGIAALLPINNKNTGSYAESSASATLATGFSVEIMGDSVSALDSNSFTSHQYITTAKSDNGPVTTLSYPSEDLGFATEENIGKIVQDSSHSTYAARYYKLTFNPGTYHISLFGAQGGHARNSGRNNVAAIGGKGANTEGVFTFTNRVSMYLFVGGAGMDYDRADSSSPLSYYKLGGFNGGGDAFSQDDAAPGGGATDLRFIVDYGDYSFGTNFITKYGTSTASLSSRIMVAAGGGGANSSLAGGSTSADLEGADGARISTVDSRFVGGGAKMNIGGAYSSDYLDTVITTGAGKFGTGGGYSSDIVNNNNGMLGNLVVPAVMASGGGGGWYGGGASANNQASGGGGSSFIAGQTVSSGVGYVDCTTGNENNDATTIAAINSIQRWETENGVSISKAKYVPAANGISESAENRNALRSLNGYAVITSLSASDSSANINDGIKGVQAQIEYEDEISMNTALSSDEYSYKTYQEDSLTLSYPGKTAYGSDNDYRNKYQTSAHWRVTLQPGVYKFSLYGAQGGSNGTSIGGYGGLSEGTLTITEKTTLFVYVGGAGTGGGAVTSGNVIAGGFNGGGAASSASTTVTAGSGGGATDVRLSDGLWNSEKSLDSRLIVAGGGGGANGDGSFNERKNGGVVNPTEALDFGATRIIGTHGTQRETVSSALAGGSGTKGAGGSGKANVSSSDITGTWNDAFTNVAGGGGGYYGGGASVGILASGAGGSSYVYTTQGNYIYNSGEVTNTDEYGFGTATDALKSEFAMTDVNVKSGANGYADVYEYNTEKTVSKHGMAVITYQSAYEETDDGDGLSGAVEEQIEYSLLGDGLTAYESLSTYSNKSKTQAAKDTLNLSYPSFTMMNSSRSNEAYARLWKLVLQPGKYKFTLAGAQGGSVLSLGYDGVGGAGALITAEITVSEKTTMYLTIGGAGASWSRASNSTGARTAYGGFNGGGDASTGAGGGGATDLRLYYNEAAIQSGKSVRIVGSNYLSNITTSSEYTDLSTRIMVAGGGGGANIYTNSAKTQYKNVVGSDAGKGSGSVVSGSNIDLYGQTGVNHSGTSVGVGGSYISQGNSALGKGGNATASNASAGGGGYYGGAQATGMNASGGGGSSYVSGFRFGDSRYPGNVTYEGVEYAFENTYFSGGYNKYAEEAMTPQTAVNDSTYNSVYAADGYASIQVLEQGVTSKYEDDENARRAAPNGTAIVPINEGSTGTYVGDYIIFSASSIANATDAAATPTFASNKVYVRTSSSQTNLYASGESGGYTSKLASYYTDVISSTNSEITLQIRRYPFAEDKSNLGIHGSPYDDNTRGDLVDGELLLYAKVEAGGVESYIPILIKVSDATTIDARADASGTASAAFSSGSDTNATATVSASEGTSGALNAKAFSLNVTTPLPIGSNFNYTLDFDTLFLDSVDGLSKSIYGNEIYAVLADTPSDIIINNNSNTNLVQSSGYAFYKYSANAMQRLNSVNFVDANSVYTTPVFVTRSTSDLTLYSSINFSIPSEVIANGESARMVFMLFSGERLYEYKGVVSSDVDFVNIYNADTVSYLVVDFTAENSRPIISEEFYNSAVTLNLNNAGDNTKTIEVADLFSDADFNNNALAVDGTAINADNIGSIYEIKEIIVPEYEYVALPSYSNIPTVASGTHKTQVVDLASRYGSSSNYYNVTSTASITLAESGAWGDTLTGWQNDNSIIAINTDSDSAFATVDYTSNSITITGLHATHSLYSSSRTTYTSLTSGTRVGSSVTGTGSGAANLGDVYILVRLDDKGSHGDNGIWLPIAIKIEDTAPRHIGENNGISGNTVIRDSAEEQSTIFSTFVGKAGDSLLVEPTFMIDNRTADAIGYYKTDGGAYVQWGSAAANTALPDGTSFASYPLCLDDDVYLRNGVYNDMVTVNNASTSWKSEFYASFGDEQTVTQFFTVDEVRVYYTAASLPEYIINSGIVKVDENNSDYYYTTGIKLNFIRSTHDYKLSGGNYVYTANYVYGTIGVRDALSGSDGAAQSMRIAIRIDPSDIKLLDREHVKTKENSISLTESGSSYTLNYRTGAQRSFIFTPYDLVTSADAYGDPIANDGLTLAAATGRYVSDGQGTFFEYDEAGSDFDPIDPFDSTYNESVVNRLTEFASLKAFTSVSTDNIYANGRRFEGGSLSHVYGLEASTTSSSMEIDILNGIKIGNNYYYMPIIRVRTRMTNAASGEPVNVTVSDGSNTLELTFTVKVYNTAPFLSEAGQNVQKLSTDPQATSITNSLQINSRVVIGDRDANDVLTFSTVKGVSVGVFDGGNFVTSLNGVTYTDYLSAELANSSELRLTALSSTQSLDRQLYVRFYAFDIINLTECFMPVVVYNSAPSLNVSGEFALDSLELTSNESSDINIYVPSGAYQSASWDIYYDAEDSDGYKYIASTPEVARDLINEGALDSRVKVLSSDSDTKQSPIITAYRYKNNRVEYVYDVVPTVGLNNSVESSNFGVVAIMSGLEEADIPLYLDIVYYIDYNTQTYAVSSIALNNWNLRSEPIKDIYGTDLTALSESLYDACFTTINSQKVFNVSKWAIRVLYHEPLAETLNIVVSYRDDFANGGDSAGISASYGGNVIFGEAGDKTIVSGKNFAHIAYDQRVSGFKTASSYTSSQDYYSFKVEDDRYVPYKDGATYRATKYDADFDGSAQNYYSYPSTIDIGAEGADNSDVYIPMSYFAMFTGSTNADYDTSPVTANVAIFDNVTTTDNTFNIVDEYINALTLTITQTGKLPITLSGSEINDAQDYVRIDFADGYSNIGTAAIRDSLLSSKYANDYLGVYRSARGDIVKSNNYNVAQLFGLKITRKGTRTANVRLSLSVKVATYTVTGGFGYVDPNSSDPSEKPSSNSSYKNWSNSFTKYVAGGADESVANAITVSVPITVANSSLALKEDKTEFDIKLNTSMNEYAVALRPNDTNSGASGADGSNGYNIIYEDADVGDAAMFYLDSVYGNLHAAEWVSSVKRSGSSLARYEAALKSYFNIASFEDSIGESYQPNDGVYGTNNVKYNSGRVPIARKTDALPGDDGSYTGNEGFSSYFALGLRSSIVNGRTVYSLVIMPRTKTVMSASAVEEVANALFHDGASNANSKTMSEGELEQVYATRGLKVKFADAAGSSLSAYERLTAYYPLRILVTDYASTSIGQNYVVPITLNIEIENAQPSSSYSTNSYELSIATGETASVNLAELLRDNDLLLNSRGEYYTEAEFKNNSDIVGISYETGDYLVSPYSYLYSDGNTTFNDLKTANDDSLISDEPSSLTVSEHAGAVAMYMNVTGSPAEGAKARDLVQSENRVAFKVNYRLSGADGEFVNAVNYEYKVYDNWAKNAEDCVTIKFTVRISNQRPTLTQQGASITLRTGDVFVVSAVDPAAFAPSESSSSHSAFTRSFEYKVFSSLYNSDPAYEGYDRYLSYESRNTASSVNFTYGNNINNNTAWDFFGANIPNFAENKLTSNNEVSLNGGKHLGYLALANDDTPWSMRITNAVFNQSYLDSRPQNILPTSEAANDGKPLSYVFRAKNAAENQTIVFTLSDVDGMSVSFTLRFTVISSPPQSKIDSTVQEVVYNNGSTPSDANYNIYLSSDGGAFTGSNPSVGKEVNVGGNRQNAYSSVYLDLSDIASDPDGANSSLSLYSGVYGNELPGYFGINKTGRADSDYISVVFNESEKRLELTLKKYNPLRVSETVEFYIRDPGSSSFDHALHVTINVYTVFSELKSTQYENSSYADDAAFIAAETEKVTVVSTSAFNENNMLYSSIVFNRDSLTDSERVFGGYIADNDFAVYPNNYTVNVYALLGQKGALTREQFIKQFVLSSNNNLTLDQIKAGEFRADTNALRGYLVSSRNSNGTFNSSLVNNSVLLRLSNYFSIEHLANEIRLKPASSTFDNDIPLFISVTKVVGSGAQNSDAVLSGGFLLNVKVENAAPVASTNESVTSVSGYAGDTFEIPVFSATSDDALFADNDIGDNVTCTFKPAGDDDYAPCVMGYIYNDVFYDGSTSALAFNDDWKSVASKNNVRAFNVTADGEKISITINRKIDFFLNSALLKYYAEYVTVVFKLTGVDLGGASQDGYIYITINNTLPTVNLGTFGGNGNQYTVTATGEEYYRIDAYISSENGALDMNFNEFINDDDMLISENNDSFRLSSVVPATSGDQPLGTTGDYLLPSDNTEEGGHIIKVVDNSDREHSVAKAYVYTTDSEGEYASYTQNGIMLSAESYDKTLNGQGFFYFRLLDRNQPGYTGNNRATGGITFAVYINILNSAPFVLDDAELSYVFEGNEGDVPAATTFSVTDFVSDRNESDIASLRVSNAIMGISMGMHYTDGHAGVTTNNLFYVLMDSTNVSNFTLNYYSHTYGKQTVTIVVTDGQYTTSFTLSVELIFASAELPVVENIQIFNSKTRNITISDLINSVSTDNEDYDVASEYTVEDITSTSSNYITVAKVNDAQTPTWAITALRETSGDSYASVTVDFSVNKIMENGTNKRFSKEFVVIVNKNTAPVVVVRSYTFSKNDVERPSFQLSAKNVVLLNTTDLLSDKEGDNMTFVKASSSIGSLVSAEILEESNQLQLTFAARGKSIITYVVRDETTTETTYRLEVANEDLPSPGLFLAIMSSFEGNSTSWIIGFVVVGIVLIVVIFLIALMLRRKRRREEVEALLVSEIEFEDKMLQIAQDAKRRALQIGSAAPPPAPMLEAPADEPQVDTSLLLNAGVEMPKNLDELNEDPEALREARRRAKLKAQAAKAEKAEGRADSKTAKPVKKSNKKPPKK